MVNLNTFLNPDMKNTVFHRLDPRTKLLLLVSLSFLAISIDCYITLLFLMGGVLALFPVAKIDVRNMKILFIMLILLVWGTIYSQSLFYQEHPRTIIFTLLDVNSLGFKWDGLHVYREGIKYGAIQSMRFSITTSFALLVYWTTLPSAMLLGLIRLKVPYGIAFMTITSLRFVPLLIFEISVVLRAQKLKGYRPFKPSNSIRTVSLLLVPVLSNCIRRSARLAVSVEGRAFRPDAPRTYLGSKALSFKPIDKALLMVSFLVIPAVTSKFFLWLYENNLFYHSKLRWVYEICGNYL